MFVKKFIGKRVAKRLIKELEANVKGMKKMGEAYRVEGGFKEISEIVESAQFGEIPPELLERGRRCEEEFCDVTMRLSKCYEELLQIIKEALKDIL